MACSFGNISRLLKRRPFSRHRILPVLFTFRTLPLLANSVISQTADGPLEPVREDAHSVWVAKWAMRHGNSPAKNRELLSWCQTAARQGKAAAQNILGNIYLKGTGAPKDFRKAVFWYKKRPVKKNLHHRNCRVLPMKGGMAWEKSRIRPFTGTQKPRLTAA